MTKRRRTIPLRCIVPLMLSLLAAGTARTAPPVGAERTDLYGDPLPPGAAVRFGTVRLRHAGLVTGVTFAPDGKTIASSSWDGTIRLWDATSGLETACLRGHTSGVHGLTFSLDGKTLVSAGNDGMISVWDVAARKCRISWQGHEGSTVAAVAISPDGKRLASGGGGNHTRTLMLWDLATGKEVRRLGGVLRTVQSVAFSPDGFMLAAASGLCRPISPRDPDNPGVVRLFDVATGRLRWEKEQESGGATSVTFTPDGKIIASAGNDSVIHLRESATGKEIRTIQVHEDDYPNPPDRKTRVYDYGGVTALAFSRDGKALASAGYDGTVRLWNARKGNEIRALRGHYRKVTGITFSPDGAILASCGNDHTIRLWEVAGGKERQRRQGHFGGVHRLAVPTDGRRLFSAGFDQTIRVWDRIDAKQRRVLRASDAIYTLAVSPDGRIVAAGGMKKGIQLWDAGTGESLRRLSGQGGELFSVVFSPDGERLASTARNTNSTGGSLFLWDASTGRELHRIVDPYSWRLWQVHFSPNSRILAAGSFRFRTVFFWDAATGRELAQWKGWDAFDFAGGADKLVLHNKKEKSFHVREFPSGRDLYQFPEPDKFDRQFLPSFCLSPDGRTIAYPLENNDIELREIATWKVRRRFIGHQGEILSLLFSVDGRTLLSGSRDTTILAWDLAHADEMRTIRITKKELPELWRDLASEDAVRADRAIWRFAAAPEWAVPFLEKRIKPAAVVAPERLARLITDLDNDRFAERDRARRELEELGELAEAVLRKLLDGKPSLEAKRRAENLLAKLRGPLPSGERLRSLRAVEVLEQIGTVEARQILHHLAGGARESRQTSEAKAALQRRRKP